MALVENLDMFVSDLGMDFTLAGAAVRGVFSNGYLSGFDIAGSSPSVILPSSKTVSTALGDAVVVGGVSYTVAGIEPDGTGMTTLRLQAV